MAIANFSDLKAAITDYTTRTTTDLGGRETDFIAMIEGRFNRELRLNDMITSGSLTISASAGLAGGTSAVPADYLEWLQATWTDGTNVADLRYVEPDSEEWRRKYRPFGRPSMFTILGANFYLRPYTAGPVSLFYYAKISPLASASTNWLLTRYPDAYLHGALLEAYLYLEEYELAATYKGLFDIDMAAIKGDADANKLARRPSHDAEVKNIAESRNQATGAA